MPAVPAWKDDPAVIGCDHRPDRRARSAADILRWSRGLLDPALRDAVGAMPETARRIAEFHFGWRDERGRPAAAPAGKAVRPALALLAAEGGGGAAGPPPAAGVAGGVAPNGGRR
ncbi:hypothetical protein ACWEUT_13480, partial [Actinomadura geliboluensis]